MCVILPSILLPAQESRISNNTNGAMGSTNIFITYVYKVSKVHDAICMGLATIISVTGTYITINTVT